MPHSPQILLKCARLSNRVKVLSSMTDWREESHTLHSSICAMSWKRLYLPNNPDCSCLEFRWNWLPADKPPKLSTSQNHWQKRAQADREQHSRLQLPRSFWAAPRPLPSSDKTSPYNMVGICTRPKPLVLFCSCIKRKVIKRKSIFVFLFFYLFARKKKTERTEIDFRFSVFFVCSRIKRKTIKRKLIFVFRFLFYFTNKGTFTSFGIFWRFLCFSYVHRLHG